MSIALIKMWFSLGAIFAMFIAVVLILFSRAKLRGSKMKTMLRIILSVLAYLLVIISGLIMIFVVFSGPVPQ